MKRWDSKPKNGGGKSLDRSATWDGSKGANFLDEIKRSSTIRSWSGSGAGAAENSEANGGRERKRSMSPASDEDELDRGRVKKVKKKKEERKMSYNPFQASTSIGPVSFRLLLNTL